MCTPTYTYSAHFVNKIFIVEPEALPIVGTLDIYL